MINAKTRYQKIPAKQSLIPYVILTDVKVKWEQFNYTYMYKKYFNTDFCGTEVKKPCTDILPHGFYVAGESCTGQSYGL